MKKQIQNKHEDEELWFHDEEIIMAAMADRKDTAAMRVRDEELDAVSAISTWNRKTDKAVPSRHDSTG